MSLYVNIKKKLGSFTLDMNFEAENETIGLLGASGCGKSVSLRCIAGIVKPDEGKIILNGKTLFDSEKKINLSPQERNIGYLFQNYALFPTMTVTENLKIGCREKLSKQQLNGLVDEKINAFFLKGLEKKYPYQLSGGQQQRVAMARIFMNNPEILLLDEPFSALDSYLQWQLEIELVETLKKFEKTAIYVSHNRDEIYHICKSVSIINNGKNEPLTDVKKMFDNPHTLSAALLSGCKNFSEIEELKNSDTKSDKHEIFAKDWNLKLQTATPFDSQYKYIGVRAHLIECCPDNITDSNVAECDILGITESLFSMIIMVQPKNVINEGNSYSKIRIEIDKHMWADTINKCSNNKMYIKMEPEIIMLLK